MSSFGFNVLQADYHRNGVGGAGFFVGVFECDEGTMLLTYFPGYDEDGEELPPSEQIQIAVLDLAKAASGNIYMYPENGQPGGNAWRGADHYRDVAFAIRDTVRARWDAPVMTADEVKELRS